MSQRTAIERSCSHSSRRGTTASPSGEFGLEQMPTVLMVGIEQELLVPFGAEDGAFDHIGAEAEIRRGPFDPLARRLVDFGPVHNTTLAHLPAASFKLRFDQYNYLPSGAEQRRDSRQNQGDRNEADVAGGQIRSEERRVGKERRGRW